MCSEQLARRAKAWIREGVDINVKVFDGTKLLVDRYAVMTVKITGKRRDGWETFEDVEEATQENKLISMVEARKLLRDPKGIGRPETIRLIVCSTITAYQPYNLLLAADFMESYDILIRKKIGCTSIGQGSGQSVVEHIP
jgi:hypothetical protein